MCQIEATFGHSAHDIRERKDLQVWSPFKTMTILEEEHKNNYQNKNCIYAPDPELALLK